MMTPEQHQEHMAKVEAGLQQIIQSQDINEAHQIAQGLLGEEEAEVKAETGAPEGLKEKLSKAMAAGGGM
jgi:hypothetical protein